MLPRWLKSEITVKKNIVIVALAFLNLVLIGALVFVWVTRGGSPKSSTTSNGAASTEHNDAESAPQEFTFKRLGHFGGNDAPMIANRAITMTATFDTHGEDGVIVAQGGTGNGYALYVQEGELFFVVRRLKVLTAVSAGKVVAGRHAVTATLKQAGEITLVLDGNAPATGQAAGPITTRPMDGLDIGADRGAAVGPYDVPNSFGGTIEMVRLKTAP